MMKNTILSLLLLCFLMPFSGFSQGRANNWYFGQGAGITFNSGVPEALTDGQLTTSEGSATVSDVDGNLLFYVGSQATDPGDPEAQVLTIWNSNHQIMPNGTNLLGSSTSSQAAIIVPNPDNENIYYVFTVDGLFQGENDVMDLTGFNYTTVDMSLDGGLGDVVPAEKNINLLATNSEKVTAVRHADCNRIWVITHFVDTFYAYLVGGAGVNPLPVTSMVLPDVPLNGYRDNAIGYLKASPDGTQLAIAHSTVSNDPGDDSESPGQLWLYDFDANTGTVSNGAELNVNGNSPYGVEFSVDSGKLYATLGVYTGSNFDHGELYQYDLTAADISGSLVEISNNDISTGALQLGPDSRIYRPILGSTSLAVINSPETAGVACDYNGPATSGVSLAGRAGRFGLPPFIQSLFNNRIDIIDGPGGIITTALTFCEGQTYTLIAEDIPGATYDWTLDGVPLPELDFDLEVATAGTYRVVITSPGECPIEGEAVVSTIPSPVANNAILEQCDGSPPDDFSIFNLGDAIADITGGASDVTVSFFDNITDAQNDTSPLNPNGYTNTTPVSQVVYARVEDNTTGCYSTAELTLNVTFNIVLSTSLSGCSNDGFATFNLSDADAQVLFGLGPGHTVAYYLTEEDALAEANPLSNAYVNVEEYSQDIVARVNNVSGCYGISNVLLLVDPLPMIAGDEEFIYCLNSFPATLTLTSGFLVGSEFDYDYEWSTGAVSESIDVNVPGIYDVTITDIITGCSATRTITVTASDIAMFDSIDITDFSDSNTVTVNVTGEGDYEYALNNDLGPYRDSNYFENVPAGSHTVYVRDKNGCGINQQDIIVIGYPKFFTPNADGINDTWQLSGTDATFQPTSRIFIFDRYGKFITELRPTSSWDGNYNGKPLPSSDYWFRIQLEDGREFTGHFALKR